MFFGKVVGTIVATRKDIHLEGRKLLIVQRTDNQGNPQGDMLVAVDYVQAVKTPDSQCRSVMRLLMRGL